MTPSEATLSKTDRALGKRKYESSNIQSPITNGYPSSDLTHQDYDVGWICALPKEQTAATAMLDKVHLDLPKPPHDQNTYTLGSIGKHNVVIACLPKGRYATISAAQVATWMTGTFPSIRVGLMVGIGGGIPPKVRLGDVIVSTPVAEHPGVIQWDMGKAEDGGHFTRTGSLNNPPTALLTALTKLETQHTLYGSKVSQYLDDLGERYPNLRSKYVWSDSLKDPLDRPDGSDLSQGHGQGSFLMLRGMITTLLLYVLGWFTYAPVNHMLKSGTKNTMDFDVDERGRKSGALHVHYGLIASGNQVIKDAKFRDRLNESLGGNILCVEMEAAGLMNDFPCIVIRGICDYADSHKNKDWQEYAAAVAAGYAKELLEITDPADVKHMPEARIVTHMLNQIASATEGIAYRQEQQIEEGERRKLFEWLSSIRPSARHFENQKQRVEGTGTWLLKDPTFLEWASPVARCPVLCCYGDPGAGKTIISSLVIDKLDENTVERSRTGLGYMYCDYRDQKAQTAENVLGTLLRQLLGELLEIPPRVWQLYQQRCDKDPTVSLKDAKHLLHVVSAEFNRVYVCLDALDELDDLRGFMELLRDRPYNMQLFLTGRPHVQDTIERYLREVQSVSITAQKGDIQRFVDREIGGPNDAEPDAMDEELRTSILEKIVESAKGIFLLPVLQIRAVLQNLTISEREKSLKTLPSTLGEAFAKSFERIQQQPVALSNRAAHIVAWISLAKQPLTVDELLCSLTVKEGDSYFDRKGVPVRKSLLNCCHGLVIIDQETSTVRLVHYSLQEYLQQQNQVFKISKTEWHGLIAATSLTFLKFPILSTTDHVQRALIKYAATQWGHHLRHNGESRSSILELAKEYLYTGWQRNPESLRLLYEDMYSWRAWGKPLEGVLPSHIGAFFGVREIIFYLGSAGVNLDMPDPASKTPLSWASESGHEPTVRLLIESGATVDSMDEDGQTPLLWASKGGHEPTVRLLIESGATVDSMDENSQTPLSWASENGHESIVRLLIESSATVDSIDQYGRTPLSWASENGHEPIVRLLFRSGAAVDSTDQDGRVPLLWASESGHEIIVRLLIESGATVDSMDQYGQTPLLRASESGHEPTVRLLIESGAAVDSMDQSGRTPLSWASEDGHEPTVRLLIESGAAADSMDQNGRTPLSWASKSGHEPTVRLLIESGATVDSMDEDGQTPLSRASQNGHEPIVRLLIEAGAAADSINQYGPTPLSRASENGHEPIVRLLIESGAAADSVDKHGETPLLGASKNGHEPVVRLLIESGAAADSISQNGQTPLSRASQNGHESTVRLLIESGAAADSIDQYGETPLSRASENGHEPIVRLLIESGAAADSLNQYGETPLSRASQNGHEPTVRLLIESGAAADSMDQYGRTPLSRASEDGHEPIVRLLIEAGAAVDSTDQYGLRPRRGLRRTTMSQQCDC